MKNAPITAEKGIFKSEKDQEKGFESPHRVVLCTKLIPYSPHPRR
jgi:hypothetical protein